MSSRTAEVVGWVLEEMRLSGERPSIERVRALSAAKRDGRPISVRQMMRPEIKLMLDQARAAFDPAHPDPTAERPARTTRRRTHAEEISSRDAEIRRLKSVVDALSAGHVSRRASRKPEDGNATASDLSYIRAMLERLTASA